MLHEYAIDPDCLGQNWDRFVRISSQLGIPYGRLVSRFPRNWLREVYGVCREFSFRQKGLLEIELKRLKKEALVLSGRPYESSKAWKSNAVEQHERKPFHAIIAEREEADPDIVLDPAETGPETPLWKVPSEITISRDLNELGAAIAELLKISNEVRFVDRFFDPIIDRFRSTLSKFIELSCAERDKIPNYEYHLSIRDDDMMIGGKLKSFQEYCDHNLKEHIPAGIRLKLIRWEERYRGEGMHARFILTERGGIQVDWGLDAGKKGQTTIVRLISHDTWKKAWSDYHENSDTFDRLDIAIVEGAKK